MKLYKGMKDDLFFLSYIYLSGWGRGVIKNRKMFIVYYGVPTFV